MSQISKGIVDTTDDSRVYTIAHKMQLDCAGDIRCSFCKYHRGENSRRRYRSMRSWKRFRKTQYKTVGVWFYK